MKHTSRPNGGAPRCNYTGKVAFQSKESAERRLHEIQASPKVEKRGQLRRVYRCPKCKYWHLTSDQNRPKRIKQRQSYNDGLIHSKRVSVEEDTSEMQKKMESLWADYLGLS